MIRGLAAFALALGSAAVLAHGLEEEAFPYLAAGAHENGSLAGSRIHQPAGQTLPLKPTRRIAFDTDEGTWMSVDLSPDGRQIVFDLLGDLYTLDAAGGHAKAITRGLAFDAQPAYSPDGQWIAFVSDRSGAENVWIARPDGNEARQVSFGNDDTPLVSPAWSADGQSIYVSRFLWGLSSYELWRYGLDGSETLVVPIKSASGPELGTLGAAVSPDGKQLFFARHRDGDDAAGVPNWSIVRREIASGKEETLIPEPPGPGRRPYPGTYFRPALSPDGKLLAYATRFRGQTGLRVRDLTTGDDRWVAFPIEHDQLQAQSWQDIVPRYTFTRDGTALLLSRNGKLERLPIAGGAATPIPFVASIDQELGPLTRVAVKQETGPVRVRVIQTPVQSPNGKTLAFSALGKLYVMLLDGHAKPHRLTQSDTPEFHPAWSPDGRNIVFVTWTAKGAGQVWLVPASGGVPRQLTDQAAFYTYPVFTPDGHSVLVARSSNRGRLGLSMDLPFTRDAELIELPLAGGAPRVVYTGNFGSRPHFAANPALAYVRTAEGLSTIDLSTGAEKKAVTVRGPAWYFMDGSAPADDSRISPDGQWVLALVSQQLHVLATPKPDESVELLSPKRAHRRITAVGADYFEWADGGKTITWAIGSTFYRRALSDIKLNPAQVDDWSADSPRVRRGTEAFQAVVEVPRDVPNGTLVLRGARVITMRADEVIDNADILIRDDHIAAVGARGSFAVPTGATIRDVTGKTIVPGFIDIHDHVADIRRDVLAAESWGLAARLAYGVTTSFDPSSLSIDMFSYWDMGDTGVLTGARVPTTGMALFSFNRLASLDEARALLRRFTDHYRTRNVKQYLIGNRRQRQWLVQAAKEAGVMPTTEGSLSLKLDLSQIIDGFSGSEHALVAPAYRDVIEFVARSRTSYDGTLQIKNGGPAAQDDFIIRDRPFNDAKFLRTRPYHIAAATALSRPWVEPETFFYPRVAADTAKIQRAGGVVGIGSHGEIPGPGFHWEMEAYVQGGMTALEALRAGTIGGAEAIGRAAEFGSIEAGKFADLVILDADPRVDIRNALAIDSVMKNGRLYDGATLDEQWPRQKAYETPWFAGEAPTPR
jgi:Tol biopolymer transport system component